MKKILNVITDIILRTLPIILSIILLCLIFIIINAFYFINFSPQGYYVLPLFSLKIGHNQYDIFLNTVQTLGVITAFFGIISFMLNKKFQEDNQKIIRSYDYVRKWNETVCDHYYKIGELLQSMSNNYGNILAKNYKIKNKQEDAFVDLLNIHFKENKKDKESLYYIFNFLDEIATFSHNGYLNDNIIKECIFDIDLIAIWNAYSIYFNRQKKYINKLQRLNSIFKRCKIDENKEKIDIKTELLSYGDKS